MTCLACNSNKFIITDKCKEEVRRYNKYCSKQPLYVVRLFVKCLECNKKRLIGCFTMRVATYNKVDISKYDFSCPTCESSMIEHIGNNRNINNYECLMCGCKYSIDKGIKKIMNEGNPVRYDDCLYYQRCLTRHAINDTMFACLNCSKYKRDVWLEK